MFAQSLQQCHPYRVSVASAPCAEQIGLVALVTGAAADVFVTALLLALTPAVGTHEVTLARLVTLTARLKFAAALLLMALPAQAGQIFTAPLLIVLQVRLAAVLRKAAGNCMLAVLPRHDEQYFQR